MAKKHIAIIGAGPGGLTAGMILAKRGYKVTIFEKDGAVFTYETKSKKEVAQDIVDRIIKKSNV